MNTMKRIALIILVLISHLSIYAEDEIKVATFSFTKDMFHIDKLENGTTYLWSKEWRFDYTFNGIYKPNAGEARSWSYYDIPNRFMPCVIYTWLNIPIDIKDNYVTFTLNKTEELIEDECILAYNPYSVHGPDDPNNIPYEEYNTPPMIYELKDYPEQNIEIFEKYLNIRENEKKWICITVWPFRYDALNKKLYLLTNIALNITFNQDDTTEILDIEESNTTQNNIIYDMQGIRLSTPPTNGIYIKNGKKMVGTSNNK